jgi:putative ABC transport system permease protein
MRDDVKTAWRSLRSSKTFTAVALIVLALGIGASTAIFSVVDAVVLRALPFDEHDRLVAVGERQPPGSQADPNDPDAIGAASAQNYLDWAAEQRVFETIAAIAMGMSTLREPGVEPEDLPSQRVTSGFFDVLRVRPTLGRAFTLDNEVEGRHRVVVLSDAIWRRRFGADAAVVGRPIRLDDGAYEVVGVMPPDFAFPVGSPRPTAMWMPYVVPAEERVRNPASRDWYLHAIGRLKDGVSLQHARSQMDQIAASVQQLHPQWNGNRGVGVRPLVDHWVGARTKSWLVMLLGAVAIVLLIACANVANLLLARSTVRRREIAVRAALGAGRWRLVRQLLVESVMLAFGAASVGILLAWWGVEVLRASMPDGVPRVANIAIDFRVLATTVLISTATGLLFGIVPALQLSKPDLTTALKDGSPAAVGGRRRWAGGALVVAEVALAVVLLVGAALFIGSFAALIRIDPGFDARNVLTAGVYPRFVSLGAIAPPPRDVAAIFGDLTERLARAPRVAHVGAVTPGLPMSGGMTGHTFKVPNRPWETVSVRWVTWDYHRALGMRLVRGRLFEPTDRKGAAGAVIINESTAKQFYPGEDPIGRTVEIERDRTIVGVVGDVHQFSLEVAPRAEVYVPMLQSDAFGADLVVRTTGDPYDVLPAVKSAVHDLFPDVPLRGVRTMEEVLARRVAQRKLNMLLLGLFGVLGLVISAVGIYGMMAYVVSQRRREIGVRMALGATPRSVVGMVLKSATLHVTIGLVIGGAGAWYLSAAAKAFLFRVEPTDPRAFAAALVALSLAALIAAAVPARRAASVDPMVALRTE